jgi:signal peptidase
VILGRVLPALGHPVYVVAGPSMEPAIPIGAAVILEQVDPAALAVGDVVSLRSGPNRAVFTHRIVRLVERDGERWIETRGDANPGPDPSVTPVSAVIGRATLMIPSGGYLLTLLSQPAGVLLILASGATLMVLGWFFESLEIDRRRRRAPAPASGRAGAIPTAGAAAVRTASAAAVLATATPARTAMPARTAVAITVAARPASAASAAVATPMPPRTAVAMAAARGAALPIPARPARATRPRRPQGAGRVTTPTVESERRRLTRLRAAGRAT